MVADETAETNNFYSKLNLQKDKIFDNFGLKRTVSRSHTVKIKVKQNFIAKTIPMVFHRSQ